MATDGHRLGDLKGIRQYGYIDYKGDINKPHLRLQETIKLRQVPLYIVQEVDNVIKEIWALDTDEVEKERVGVDEGGESDNSEGGEMDDDIISYIASRRGDMASYGVSG